MKHNPPHFGSLKANHDKMVKAAAKLRGEMADVERLRTGPYKPRMPPNLTEKEDGTLIKVGAADRGRWNLDVWQWLTLIVLYVIPVASIALVMYVLLAATRTDGH